MRWGGVWEGRGRALVRGRGGLRDCPMTDPSSRMWAALRSRGLGCEVKEEWLTPYRCCQFKGMVFWEAGTDTNGQGKLNEGNGGRMLSWDFCLRTVAILAPATSLVSKTVFTNRFGVLPR